MVHNIHESPGFNAKPNTASHLTTKCHNVMKKCHNVTEKCHAMTFFDCEIQNQMQPRSAGYVKVKLIAGPLTESKSCQVDFNYYLTVTHPTNPFLVNDVEIFCPLV